MNDHDTATTQPATIRDGIRDIASAFLDTLVWICSFNLTKFITRIMGRDFDPEGSLLPEWKYEPQAEKAFVILPEKHSDSEGEGLATYDNVVYVNAKQTSKEPWELEVLTQNELIALHQYKNPVLTNMKLAKGVKYYLKKEQNDYAIAVLLGYAEKTVQHYRLALEKASKKNT